MLSRFLPSFLPTMSAKYAMAPLIAINSIKKTIEFGSKISPQLLRRHIITPEQIKPITIGAKLAAHAGKMPFWAQTFIKFPRAKYPKIIATAREKPEAALVRWLRIPKTAPRVPNTNAASPTEILFQYQNS